MQNHRWQCCVGYRLRPQALWSRCARPLWHVPIWLGIGLLLVGSVNAIRTPIPQVLANEDNINGPMTPHIPCADNTDVPESECQVLLDFYYNNDGGSWFRADNWSLELAVCTWWGVTCVDGHVTQLELPDNNIGGTLPAAFANLPELSVLILPSNRLSGAIPTELTTLSKLSRLRLDGNQLSGGLPTNLGDLSRLTVFWISDNTLSGALPTSMANLSRLREFYANGNDFSGPIPPGLGALPDLHSVYLAGNQLNGSIPGALGNMPNLSRLVLLDNQLSGSIPISLTNASKLTMLLVNQNPLSGPLPATMGDLLNLERLDFSDTQINGPLPSGMTALTALTRLEFQNSSVCIPTDSAFQSWLQQIATVTTNNNPCTEIATPTATVTATPSPTATPTVTPATPAPTPTTTRTPIIVEGGDQYEPNDSCATAQAMPTDGTFQQHTVHHAADVDWVQFPVEANEYYLVRIDPPPDSTVYAEVAVFLDCATAAEYGDRNFAPGVHIEFRAPSDGTVYLRISDRGGDTSTGIRTPRRSSYDLSIRHLRENSTPGALILVAGSLYGGDLLQPNIYHVTDNTRRIFRKHGYTDDDIYYLAPDADHPNVDAVATTANLETAITSWAANRVGVGRPLTIYLIDHGSTERIYLDKEAGEWVTPTQLDGWLTTLEAQHPGLLVNVVIEMCYAGTFISAPQTISRPNRVVIASTDDVNLAYASSQGAHFSDRLLEALDHRVSLYSSFQLAQNGATAATFQIQRPWLDADGDGEPNEQSDFLLAAQRGFDLVGTLGDEWPPYIAAATVAGGINGNQGIVQAEVLDDETVEEVWAIIYPPSYRAPVNSEALVQIEDDETLTVLRLRDTDGDGIFSSSYSGFTEQGNYRIVIHAEDDLDLAAQPVAITVPNGNAIYLPLVLR